MANSLPISHIQDFGVLLMSVGYEIFLSNLALCGFKGLVGRITPIGVQSTCNVRNPNPL